MSGLLKSRDYLMKCLGFVLLLGVISLGAIGGCDNNGGGQDGTQALTESDFFNTLDLFANPEDGVVMSFLESTEAPGEDNLTGELGFDIIPYRYTRTLNHTFCFEDDNDDSMHFMILQDSDGGEVLRVLANEGCVTGIIEAGDYEVVLTHGEHVDEQETIFLRPALGEERVARGDKFNQMGIKTANSISSEMHRYLPGELVKFYESISNVFTRRAIAQTPDDFTTLIDTNACVKCDLSGANLGGAILSEANLSNADLSEANLVNAFMFGANLLSADLSNAILFGANLTEANLRFADLTGAFLSGANLLIADLTGANLSNADLSEVILSNAVLTGANLLSADLSNAILLAAFLSGANLSNAILSEANLSEANLSNADLSNASLFGANLSEANLSNAILTGANLSNAIWCDGICICALNSIETCVGCAPVDLCDG